MHKKRAKKQEIEINCTSDIRAKNVRLKNKQMQITNASMQSINIYITYQMTHDYLLFCLKS